MRLSLETVSYTHLFFRAGHDSSGQQPVKALLSVFIAFPSCHPVSRIITLIPLIAGEYIQISTVQLNAMAEEILEIPLDIIGCLGSAQIGLGASRPPFMFRYRAVRKPYRIFFIKGIRIQIVISVLVMDPE